MKVLVNGLSIGSLSGSHVLFGHIRQLAQWTAGEHEFLILHQADATIDIQDDLPNVTFEPAPASANNWIKRSLWEFATLPGRMKQWGVDLYFTPSGTILPRSPVPQVSLAQNPWCMVKGLQRNRMERLKARLQRAAYRRAFRQADLMVYNSNHMRTLYRANAPNVEEGASIIAHQGIGDGTHAAAAQDETPREPDQIVSVSVMAHWKGTETLVAAMAELQKRGVAARLCLVGPWADDALRADVERRIDDLNLRDTVEIAGMVSREELHRQYASARVFCLMSRCESFGIPAVEAQVFGTPVVGGNTTAMPEVGGKGGRFVAPDDVSAVADELEQLLRDDEHWQRLSDAARANAARYRWEECSRPLLQMFALDDGDDQTAPAHRPVAQVEPAQVAVTL